jgi:lipoprotein-anchoring transpeptidase ErfK/SrfK
MQKRISPTQLSNSSSATARGAYSSYQSARQPYERNSREAASERRSKKGKVFAVVILLAILMFAGLFAMKSGHTTNSATLADTTNKTAATKPVKTAAVAAAPAPNPCASNTLSQLALVSISKRHMWACDGTTSVYDSPVVTGMEMLAADLTPTGTYHIYAKETDLTLSGSDSTGSWNDPVSYWMPFLDNQYGAYGFHDATWRAPGDFGNISPNSTDASHGCVELPLATAKWLYAWAVVGTTVTIES